MYRESHSSLFQDADLIREITFKYGGNRCGNAVVSLFSLWELWKVMNSKHARSNMTLEYQWPSCLGSHINQDIALSSFMEAMQQLVTPLCLSKKLIMFNQEINLETYSSEYHWASFSDLSRQRTST